MQSVRNLWRGARRVLNHARRERSIPAWIALLAVGVFLLAGMSKAVLDAPGAPPEVPAAYPTAVDTREAPRSTFVLKPAVALLQHGYYINSLGTPVILGEVENTGNVDLDKVEIIVMLYDGERFLGSDNGFSFAEIVQVGERALFRAHFSDPPETWDRYEIQVQAEPASDYLKQRLYDGLTITEINVERRDSKWVAFGKVKNTGSRPMRIVQVVVGLYDAGDRLLGIADGYVDLDRLAPGVTSTFTVDTYVDYLLVDAQTAKVAAWRVEVHGYPDE
ncbi:MAG: hypothetical protein JXB47_09270 [Anaerolineae bacterium]|nr:hypothetical protein [Anaerolineae bacterium]